MTVFLCNLLRYKVKIYSPASAETVPKPHSLPALRPVCGTAANAAYPVLRGRALPFNGVNRTYHTHPRPNVFGCCLPFVRFIAWLPQPLTAQTLLLSAATNGGITGQTSFAVWENLSSFRPSKNLLANLGNKLQKTYLFSPSLLPYIPFIG